MVETFLPFNLFKTKWKKTVVKVLATKKFITDKMSGRVDIHTRIFEKIAKNLSLKSQDQKNKSFESI